MEPWLYVRAWPTDAPIAVDDVEQALDGALDAIDAMPWAGEPFGAGSPEAPGFVFSQRLEQADPDALIRDVRQTLALARYLALQRPDWWVEVWDDLGLVEGTFGAMLSMIGGQVVDRESGEVDEARESRLADHLTKVWLYGLDLGMPADLDDHVRAAVQAGVADPALAPRIIAAADAAEEQGFEPAAERIASLLDGLDAATVRPLILDGFDDHAAAVRRRWASSAASLPAARAIEEGLELLFACPVGFALEEAVAAVAPYADDPRVIEPLVEVVTEEVPPQPGTRLEGAAADLLLTTEEGARAVARRAARDRDAEPLAWWAVRKLTEQPRPEIVPTVLLYGAPGRRIPDWLAACMGALDDPRAATIARGGHLDDADVAVLREAEATWLGHQDP